MTGFGVAALCGVLFLCFIQNVDAAVARRGPVPKRPPSQHGSSFTNRERREIPKLQEKTASVSHQLKESEDVIVVQKRAVPDSSFSGNLKSMEPLQTKEKQKRSVAYEPTLNKHMVEVQPNSMQKRSVAFEPKVESNVEAVQPNYMQKRAAAPVKLANEEVSSVVKSKRAIQQEAVEKEHFLNKEELWKKNAIEKRDIAAMSQLIEKEKQFEGIVFPELDGGLGKEAAVIQKRESGGFGGAAEI